MKDIIRLVITHFFIITVSVLFFVSLINQLNGAEAYSADFPWVIMLTGVIGAIPSALFYYKKEPTKNQFRLRQLIHYVVIEAIIMTEGFILKWYESFMDGLLIFGIVLLVYIVVFAYTYFVAFNTAHSINNALEDFNSDEEE